MTEIWDRKWIKPSVFAKMSDIWQNSSLTEIFKIYIEMYKVSNDCQTCFTNTEQYRFRLLPSSAASKPKVYLGPCNIQQHLTAVPASHTTPREQHKGSYNPYTIYYIQPIYHIPIHLIAYNMTLYTRSIVALISGFMGPTWGPSGAVRTQVGPMLAQWTLLSGLFIILYQLTHCGLVMP